ncbi:MAG: VOC family protein [Elusimicrobiota bacterium]|nr:MAG: VOC family protein [Elusimicrobiota bacterium]
MPNKPEIKGLEHLYIPTGKFEDAWRFWTDIAGGKPGETWGEGEARSGMIQLGGQSIVLGGDAERDEDPELGYPVRHGAATLYFSTPNLDKLYRDLANRGASILRGPLKTHWGAKVMTVKAGDAVIAFIETKKKTKKRK